MTPPPPPVEEPGITSGLWRVILTRKNLYA
jgi:hypothetical protein